jgi:hypothetical protein
LFPRRHPTLSPLFGNGALARVRSALRAVPVGISASLWLCLALAGCNRLRPEPKTETVYVLAKETFLRDRVAAVSNRVAMVQNGERLQLLERERRFLKVKTEKGEIGWIEEHSVVNPEVVSGFEQLHKAHANDPVVVTAVARDDGYLHLKPGRDTDRYYLLLEGVKLQLLIRASVPKAIGPQASRSSSYFASPSPASTEKKSTAKKKAEQDMAAETNSPAIRFDPAPPPPPPDLIDNAETAAATAETIPEPPAPVPMEDWWLVRDGQGRVGWLMSRRLDVDVPDEIAQYAEGQKMVAAYLLRNVYDPDSKLPDGQAPEYVTVLNPYQDGLPYDFNQVRVFTWNVKRHRYETAFRQRNLQGYLPVVVTSQTGGKTGPSPTFQITQGIGDSVTIDPDTGVARPASTEVSTYVLEDERVRKVAPQTPASPQRAALATSTEKSARRSHGKKGPREHRRAD